jgi:hypothetical protein
MTSDIKGKATILGLMALLLLPLIGFVNNIIWTFSQVEVGSILLGIVGIGIPPIGIIHGLIVLL